MAVRFVPQASGPARYAVAVLAPAAAALLRAPIQPLLGEGVPFILFFPVTMLCSWFGGFGPGLVATALGALLANAFFMGQPGELALQSAGDAFRLGVFVLAGVFISWMGGGLRESLARELGARREAERIRDFTQRVLEHAPVAVGVVEGPDLRFTLANPMTGALLGRPAEALVGMPHREVAPEAHEVVGPVMERVARTGVAERHSVDVVLPSNESRSFIISWTPLPADSGSRPVLFLALDVTEARRAEAALRETETELESLVDADVIGVFFADVSGAVTRANDAFLALAGRTRAELERGEVRWTDVTAPESLPADADRLAEARDRGACAPYETELRRPDGSRVPVLVGFTLVGPARDRAVAFALDLTERRRAEREREALLERERAARRELEAAGRMKDEFLATVSHELRTPLNSMLGWARLLKAGRLDPDTLGRAVDTIERNAASQVQLIEDLLDVSRIVSGHLRLSLQDADLVAVITAAVDSVRPAAEARSIRLQLALDSTAGPVLGDPERLQQVVWNLVSNAVKFTPKGGRVTVTLERINSHVEITVADSGQGIPAAFLPFVFERFRQADGSTTRSHGGLGLGLSIVRHLVEAHGGTVEASSPGEGRGARFTVTLPLPAAQRPVGPGGRVHSAARSAPALDAERPLAGLRVLVVDDEEDTRELLSFLLRDAGAEARAEASARQALAALAELRPHVLLSDVGMPDEDGYELIRRVRQLEDPEARGVAAVAVTAFARGEDRVRLLSAGFQAHLPKPVEPAELLAVVASLGRRP